MRPSTPDVLLDRRAPVNWLALDRLADDWAALDRLADDGAPDLFPDVEGLRRLKPRNPADVEPGSRAATRAAAMDDLGVLLEQSHSAALATLGGQDPAVLAGVTRMSMHLATVRRVLYPAVTRHVRAAPWTGRAAAGERPEAAVRAVAPGPTDHR